MNKELFALSYSLRKDFEKKVSFILFFIFCIFLVINVLVSFVIFPVRNRSVSMGPDLGRDTCVMFSPLKRNVERGEVVLLDELEKGNFGVLLKVSDCVVRFFTAQQISLVSERDHMGCNRMVRRVIGLPGDTIYMRDYVMYIKPEGQEYFLTEFELVEEVYNVLINAAPSLWDNSIGVLGSFDEMTLGENQYFVLGDHRNSVIDSRLWGAVDRKNIKALALVTYFPFNKFHIYN